MTKYIHVYDAYNYKNQSNRSTENQDIFTKNYRNIFNYGFNTTLSISIWTLNNKYNIFDNINNSNTNVISTNKQIYNIYTISTFIPINDFFNIMQQNLFPLNQFNVTNFILDKTLNIFKQKITKINFETNNNINLLNIILNNFEDIKMNLSQMTNINFIFIHINILNLSNFYINQFKQQINGLYLLFILSYIVDKINIGSNMVISFNMHTFKFNLQVLTLYISLFQEYYIYKNEASTSDLCYCILKNKKEVSSDYIQNIKKILNDFFLPNYDIELYNKFKYIYNMTNDDKQLFTGSNINFFKQIIFKDDNLKKIFNKLVLDVNQLNYNYFYKASEKLYKKILILDTNTQDQYITDELKKKSLLNAIQFAQENNIPLKPEYDLYTLKIKYQRYLFKDLVTFQKRILYKFDSHKINHNNINLSQKIDFRSLPDYYIQALHKEKLELIGLENRKKNKDVYNKVHDKLQYYNIKLNNIVAEKYNITKDKITIDWIQMTEILNNFNIINNKATLNTFHLFRSSDKSFLDAINNYITNKTSMDIDKWSFVSEPLKNISDNEKYIKKYAKNIDLITSDYEIDNKTIFSIYLLVFALLKSGGNCIIKRKIPINNNQELSLLYIFYAHFREMYFFKSNNSNDTTEYYLVGINYSPISDDLLNKLLLFLKNYELSGLIDVNNIDYKFLSRLDKTQHKMIDRYNKYIRQTVYFIDMYHTISEETWKQIEDEIEETINMLINEL
jgi:hypothetical protein